jgi:hypothetical protein
MASKASVKGLCRWHTLKQPKLEKLDKLLYKWFTVVRSEEKHATGPMIIKKTKSFYNKMKMTVKCTLSMD